MRFASCDECPDGIESQDLRLRFFVPVKEFGHAFISRLTQLDYERAIAFVALQKDEIIGVVRRTAMPIMIAGSLLSWCDRISRDEVSVGD